MPSIRAIAVLATAALACGAANADVVAEFAMHDHPDGAVAPPLYGLRVDNLFGEGNVNTFSIDHFGDSTLTVRDDGGELSIHMAGTLYGGHDAGSEGADPGAYTYEFTYSGGVEAYNGGWRVAGTPGVNTGYIGEVDGHFYAAFTTKANTDGISFIIAPDGRRLPGDDSAWVGRGWVEVIERGGHTQDWLFTAEVIPAPGTLALALGGGVLALPRRRRK